MPSYNTLSLAYIAISNNVCLMHITNTFIELQIGQTNKSQLFFSVCKCIFSFFKDEKKKNFN